MEEVIDIRTLQCYQKATEEQRKKCTSKLSFEIGKLPTLKLQEEWTFYIKHCGEVKSLSSVRQETVYFKRVCEFMNHLSVDSMKVQTKAVWGQQFESWVSAQGLKAYRESNKNKNWRERTPIVLYFLHMLDFIDSEMSGQRIYFKDLACYQEASEEERKKCGREPYFDLSLLPTQQLRKEWGAYIKESARIYTLGTSFQHRVYYNQICRFLNSRIVCVKSMREQSKEKWEYQFKRWLMTEGIQINRKSQSVYSKEGIARNPNISYLLRMVDFTCPNIWEDETEKDIWELEKLPIEIKNNPIKKVKTLNFTNIRQPDMRNEIKKGIYLLLQKEAIATVTKGITAGKRLTEYLHKKHPKMQSLGELDRDIFEEYLIHLKTDRTRTKSLHGEITRLRALLEAVGKTYKYPILENLIINRDIPPTARAEFRTYSDEELKRLNAEIVKMNEQKARLMILHQMLGTRISDTLTLRTDCLRGQPGDRVVHIRQMKTHPYEKPVSEEIAILIERSIQYTKKKWGETEYIFVSDSDPSLPAQYNRIQTQVVQMIREKDLRDDYGRLFGFGTHMYRHYYGVKLTEMHLDDWTIARLLGHSSVHNVKYYRKMSNQILADETRKVRERLSQLILENLDGWGEEYEQVRYDVSCK